MSATLFSKAKTQAPASTAVKGKDKIIVPVHMGTKIKDLTDKRNELKTLEAEVTMLEGEILPVARTEYMKLVRRMGRHPGSYLLQSGGSNILVITQDKYLKITEAKEQALIDNKLGNVIEEKTVFSFDPVLLEKHEKQISKAIAGIKTMTDEEKDLLIVAKVEKTVKKGTIELLATFDNPDLAYQLCEPVTQLKGGQ